jgi:hypothetical protein
MVKFTALQKYDLIYESIALVGFHYLLSGDKIMIFVVTEV